MIQYISGSYLASFGRACLACTQRRIWHVCDSIYNVYTVRTEMSDCTLNMQKAQYAKMRILCVTCRAQTHDISMQASSSPSPLSSSISIAGYNTTCPRTRTLQLHQSLSRQVNNKVRSLGFNLTRSHPGGVSPDLWLYIDRDTQHRILLTLPLDVVLLALGLRALIHLVLLDTVSSFH